MFASALLNFGVAQLLDLLLDLAPEPSATPNPIGSPAPPIGIQPSAYSAMWANIFGPAPPPMSTAPTERIVS